ncbi:MAG: hypothetical protein AAB152_16625 [Candidatus Coatesbacteria bacterium]
MRRGLGWGLAAALVGAPLAPTAVAMDIQPQDEYVAGCTFLGGMGGAALGVSLGGLSRPLTSSRVTPFLRYGSLGALFGSILGYEIGTSAVESSRAAGDVPPPAMRETTACLGALAGELVGLGLGALVSRPAGHVNRDTREVWAGISLGAVVGAAGGFLMQPVRLLVPPAPRSARDVRVRREQERIEPILPVAGESKDLLAHENDPRLPPEAVAPGLTPAGVERLSNQLLQPESERLTGAIPRLRNDPVAPILPDLQPPAVLVTMARSTLVIGLLEGAAIGMAAAGSLNGESRGFLGRLAGGGAVGALGGMSAAAALSRPWLDPKRIGQTGVEEGLADGKRTSGVMAGGILGTLLGGAIGAVLHNTTTGIDRADISLCALGGNAAGLLVGTLLTAPHPSE